jgi:hypothetical protein
LLQEIGKSKRRNAQRRKFEIWKNFTTQLRLQEQKELYLKTKSMVKIQCMVRRYLSKIRVLKKRKLIAEIADQRRQKAVFIIQSFFRIAVAINRVNRLKRLYPEHLRMQAAALIQRVFRGFLGRAVVLNIERRKLLKFLRSWSRGKTGNLFHISVLQEIDAHAVIYTAISFAMLPSKPARNLPSLRLFRQYRAGLFALYWQIQSRFVTRRDEKLKRRSERQRMLYEDLYSHAFVSLQKAQLLKEKQLAEIEEAYRQAQEREAVKRMEYLTQQSMINLYNKQELKVREEKEGIWRSVEAVRKEEKWVQLAIIREFDREWEMMTAEDGRSAIRRQLEKEIEANNEYIAVEAKKVVEAKIKGWYENKFIESRRMRASLSEVTLKAHMEKYESFISALCVNFLRSLPFSDEVQLYFQQKFLGEYSSSCRDKVISTLVFNLLKEKNFSYRLVQKELLLMNKMQNQQHIPSQNLLILLNYLSTRTEVDETTRELLCNRSILNQLVPLQIKGKILKLDNHHHFFAKEEYIFGVPLRFRVHVPATDISQYAHLLEYKHIKKTNRASLRSLAIALAQFQQVHTKLRAIRKDMKEGKLLRSSRKEKLFIAASYEEILFVTRERIIDEAMLLYNSIYYEIRLFLDLFYPSENNYYYRNLNKLLESPSAMGMKSNTNEQATTAAGAADSASEEKPSTPGSPHSGARRKGFLRHSVDGSSTADNEVRRAGDAAQSLFQSPDQRNSPHRKRSISSGTGNEEEEAPAETAAASPTAKDAATMKSNRKKGSGMARDAIRRKSMGSTDEKPNPFASNSPAAGHLSTSHSFTKVKLPARKFNYLIDDPEDYWEDLLEVCGEAYVLLSTEIIALLAAPPKPSCTHDGYRHVLKVRSILVQQSHYGPNGPIPRSVMKSSPSKGGVSFGSFASTTSSTAGGKGHIRWAKKRDVFTPMGPQAKERKYFDIPGENAFMEKDVDKYDFYHWAQGIHVWARDIIQQIANLSQAWKSKHERQLLTFMVAHRLNYLLSLEDEEVATATDQSSPQNAFQNVKLQQFIQSNELDAADIYDVLLCTYELAVTATVNIGKGKVVESSIKISAPELDYVLSRQPFSYLARQLMIQNISDWYTRYFSMYPENLRVSNANQLREYREHPLIPLKQPWQQQGLEIFPIIAKEYGELADIANVILDNNLLAFDMYHQKLQWHTAYADQPADFSIADKSASPMRLASLRNKILRKVGVTVTQTATKFAPKFPRFMQPVFRFGATAPPESFQKQLLREKKAGIAGKYTKLDAKDQKIDIRARKLLQQLFKRCLLKRFLLNCWHAQEVRDYDRQCMMLEDARALLIRKREKEDKHRQRAQTLSYRLSRGCMSVIVGAVCCRALGPPKVFPMGEWNRFDEAYRLLRTSSFARLQRRYRPKRGLSIDYQKSPVALKEMMRFIASNNFRLTSAPDFRAFVQREEMFRVVEWAAWEALEQDLADIDTIHITEATHFRWHSWYTGQMVAVNTATGNQMELRSLLQRQLPAMSQLYATMSELPSEQSTDRAIDAMVNTRDRSGKLSSSLRRSMFRSTTESTSELPTALDTMLDTGGDDKDHFDEKELTEALRHSLKRDQFGRTRLQNNIRAGKLPPPVSTYRRFCPEYWIAGGIHRVMVAMRIVEHEQWNERGIIIVDDVEVPSPQVSNLLHIRRTYNHRASDVPTREPAKVVPGSPLVGRQSDAAISDTKASSSSSSKASSSPTNKGASGTSTTTSNRRKHRQANNATKANEATTTMGGGGGSSSSDASNSPKSPVSSSSSTTTTTTKSSYRRKNALTTSIIPLVPSTVLERHQREEKLSLQRHHALLTSGRGLDGDYNDRCVALIVRGGFSYQPLCSCCAFTSMTKAELAPTGSLAQWGDLYHTHQKRYYCRWHWLRVHARHAYHPQHDAYYAHRGDSRFVRRELFPVWRGPDAGPTWSSKWMVAVSTPETMREDLLRFVLRRRYERWSPDAGVDLYRALVRVQARVRGVLGRRRLERDRHATASAMNDALVRAPINSGGEDHGHGHGNDGHGDDGGGSGGAFAHVLAGGALTRRLSRLSSRLWSQSSHGTGSARELGSSGVASPHLGSSPMTSVHAVARKRLPSADATSNVIILPHHERQDNEITR